MYILFADSGSTKTLWKITDKNFKEIAGFQTIGLNPYFVMEEKIINEITLNYPTIPNISLIEKVHFYGSGCEERDEQPHLREALQKTFKKSEIFIYSDMLGAARAILKNKSGIAAILGTGCNSCLYDGKKIVQNAISLGFILGDEGSGAHIGKMFAKNYLELKFDNNLNKQILNETGANHSSILNAIYTMPNPSRYLAGFCRFIFQNITHPQLKQIVSDCFDCFFEKYITIYPNYNKEILGFCGGISKSFRDLILISADNFGFDKVVFVENLLEEIIEYHKLIYSR